MTARARSLDEFEEYLRAGQVPARFLPAYRRAAESFLGAYRDVPLSQLDARHVDHFLERARRQGVSERRLRNLQVACGTLVTFLTQRAVVGAGRSGRGRRKLRRIPFIQDVVVDGAGHCRSVDLSAGGMYIETVNPLGVGTLVRLSFRLRATDDEAIVARARVVYEHPELGAGVAFVDLDAAARTRLQKFIRSR